MPRRKQDPLIAAMIAKLPSDEEWPVERQIAWLHLMAMAFGTVYGGDVAAQLGQRPVVAAPAPAPKPAAPKAPAFPFYIDETGTARRKGGAAIKASDVSGEIYDLRGQDGDMKTIKWADGSTGLNGADLTIIAV